MVGKGCRQVEVQPLSQGDASADRGGPAPPGRSDTESLLTSSAPWQVGIGLEEAAARRRCGVDMRDGCAEVGGVRDVLPGQARPGRAWRRRSCFFPFIFLSPLVGS